MQDILLLNYDDNGNAYLIRKDKKRWKEFGLLLFF
jgi:hypothetical protein